MSILNTSFSLKDLIAAQPCTREFKALMNHIGIDISGLGEYGLVQIDPRVVRRGLKDHLDTRITLKQVYDGATSQAYYNNLVWVHLYITMPELKAYGIPPCREGDRFQLYMAVIEAQL